MNENTPSTPTPKNPFVVITAIISGVSIGIVALMAGLAGEHVYLAAWIVAALAAMGVVLGFFSFKRS